MEGPHAFADDLAILLAGKDSASLGEMQETLDRLNQFCSWAGLEVSTAKTEVTGIDFEHKKDLAPELGYQSKSLPICPANKPFQYLGFRLCINGNTDAERKYIINRTELLAD